MVLFAESLERFESVELDGYERMVAAVTASAPFPPFVDRDALADYALPMPVPANFSPCLALTKGIYVTLAVLLPITPLVIIAFIPLLFSASVHPINIHGVPFTPGQVGL